MTITKEQIGNNQNRLELLIKTRNKIMEHIIAGKELEAVMTSLCHDFSTESLDNNNYSKVDVDELHKNSIPYDIIKSLSRGRTLAILFGDIELVLKKLSKLSREYKISEKDFLSTQMSKIGFEKGSPEDITNIDIVSKVKAFKKNMGIITTRYDVGFNFVRPGQHQTTGIEHNYLRSFSTSPQLVKTFNEAVKKAKYEKFAAIHIAVMSLNTVNSSGVIKALVKDNSGKLSIISRNYFIDKEPIWVNQDPFILGHYLMNKI